MSEKVLNDLISKWGEKFSTYQSYVQVQIMDDNNFLSECDLMVEAIKKSFKKGYSLELRMFNDVCYGCKVHDAKYAPPKGQLHIAESNESLSDAVFKAYE